MRIEKLEPSRRKKGRILAFLEDGSLLRLTEQELLDFQLHAGSELDETTLRRLQSAASESGAKAEAAQQIGRRAMSRADLMKKLRDKDVSQRDAAYAAEWLEAIGALDDAQYAALLVRHCASMGYGPARFREELRKHGIDRSLWDDAMDAAPEASETVDRFLQSRFKGRTPEEKELKKASDALLRRGFSWAEVKSALRRYTEDLPED